MTLHHQSRDYAICLSSQYSDNSNSPQKLYSTPCNHHFHFECLKRWCQINNSCPTCHHDNVMNLSNNNENSTISEIYSIYVNNYNDQNNSEPSSFFEDKNLHLLNMKNLLHLKIMMIIMIIITDIINIDCILDNIRNDAIILG